MEKVKVALLLSGDYSWAGGLYYSLNLIKTFTDNQRQSEISFLICHNNSTPREVLEELNTYQLEYFNVGEVRLIERALNKLHKAIFSKGFRFSRALKRRNVAIVFPLLKYEPELSKGKPKPVYWLYDFQHKFLPEFFSDEEIAKRDRMFKEIADYGENIVVSSKNAEEHFRKFYPESKARIHIFQFASIIDSPKDAEVRNAISNYGTSESYFIICNQFWKHKNHLTALKAFKLFRERSNRTDVKLVLTGKLSESDPYVKQLQQTIADSNLSGEVIFTGFIPRNEQIALMKGSMAVIQPSYFEGWSTVIEDAKALGKLVLASDLAVHREQLNDEQVLFARDNAVELTTLMLRVSNKEISHSRKDYSENIAIAAKQFINLVRSVNVT